MNILSKLPVTVAVWLCGVLFAQLGVPGNAFAQFPGRLAISADGNQQDLADIGATPMALAILAKAGLTQRLAHYEYNNHIWSTFGLAQKQVTISSALGVPSRFGFEPGIVFNPEPEPTSEPEPPPPSDLCSATGTGATREEGLRNAILAFQLACGVVYKSSPDHDCDPTNAAQTAWTCSTSPITALTSSPAPEPTPIPPPSGSCSATGTGATREEGLRNAILAFELACGVVYKSSPDHDCDPTNAAQTAWTCSTSSVTGTPPPPEPTPIPPPPSTCTGVAVPSGIDVAAFMQGFVGGTTYCFTASAPYRLTRALVPKSGDVWMGPGIISGARLLTGFTFDGARWSVGGQTAEGAASGSCWPTHPRCNRPEELFVNDVRQKHVASVSAVVAGTWFFDYAADRVYLGDNPDGKLVELSATPQATAGNAQHVTIHGLTFEKFSSGAQQGAIHGIGTVGWVVRDSIIRNNHGIGLRMGDAMQVLRNTINHNGQLGIGGSGHDLVIEGNTWAYNNAAGFNAYWEAGGAKFTRSRNLIIRNNFVHHNDGPGIQTDIDNIDVLVEGNRVDENTLSGIFHEIGYKAVIRRNIVRGNGTRRPDPWWVDGACILISSSPDVEVYENVCEGNFQGIAGLRGNRGTGAYGPRILQNLWVHDNQVDATAALGDGSGRSGIAQNAGTLDAFTTLNNRFDRNTYRLGSAARYFMWMNQDRTEAEWRAYGHDMNGTIIR